MKTERYYDYMELAFREAEEAFKKNEVPVGAVVVFEDKIIGRGYNQVESLHDATAHAEIIALSAAYNHFDDWRLENSVLVSTWNRVLCVPERQCCRGLKLLSMVPKMKSLVPADQFLIYLMRKKQIIRLKLSVEL